MGTFALGLKFAYIRSEKDRKDALEAIEGGVVCEEHPNDEKQAMPDTTKAGGIPLQIVFNGHPIVSMQRRRWRPDAIADDFR